MNILRTTLFALFFLPVSIAQVSSMYDTHPEQDRTPVHTDSSSTTTNSSSGMKLLADLLSSGVQVCSPLFSEVWLVTAQCGAALMVLCTCYSDICVLRYEFWIFPFPVFNNISHCCLSLPLHRVSSPPKIMSCPLSTLTLIRMFTISKDTGLLQPVPQSTM